MALIYCMRNEISGEMYIGQTKKTLKQRMIGHKSSTQRKNTIGPFANMLKSVGLSNFIAFEIETVEEAELDEAEIFWIAYFRSIGAQMLNVCDGGKGVKGLVHTEKTKMSIAGKQLGKKASEATKQKMSSMRKGEDNSTAKLTEEKVSEIRLKYEKGNISQRKLAKEYLCTQAQIWNIVNRKQWTNVM